MRTGRRGIQRNCCAECVERRSRSALTLQNKAATIVQFGAVGDPILGSSVEGVRVGIESSGKITAFPQSLPEVFIREIVAPGCFDRVLPQRHTVRPHSYLGASR